MIATGRVLQRHWASGPDQAIAGFRYVGLFADLETPRPTELTDALSGSRPRARHARVALTPQPGKRIRWSRISTTTHCGHSFCATPAD
jgi:hypothetical protein